MLGAHPAEGPPSHKHSGWFPQEQTFITSHLRSADAG